MSKRVKQLSNSFSTGGGGPHFEAHVQASFVTLMLTGGFAPCLPCWPITKIKLQGKNDGYDTDDLIVFVEKNDTKKREKLIGQIKYSIRITQSDSVFSEVIQAAWNDFNNPYVFTKSNDIIALITGPLSGIDARNIPWLLDQAKYTSDADEFDRNVKLANFGPAERSDKLDIIRHHLKLANNDSDVPEDEIYSFLNHFCLLQYDLGKEVGVVLSLLHSHISQFNQQDPQWIWSRIVDIVQTWNQNAGAITKERIPEDLKEALKQPVFVYVPEELARPQPETVETGWRQHQYATDLALANLVGAWNEKNEVDICVLSKLTDQSYMDWILKVREILQHPNSPIALREGLWKITERANLWEALGPRIFDDHLDIFRESAVEVLSERDPAFELSMEERYAATIHGKVLTRSPALRDGLAEGLAILGSRPNTLTNCSPGKAKTTADRAIDEIFKDADWVLWVSLNRSLPALAEAAPDKFLEAVKNALGLSPCPFDELFSLEGIGITGSNYLTGLLWALERLAWDSRYLVRVCVILGELASRDLGEANRPHDSLSKTLLPWSPQTTASIEKRKVAVQILCNESPEIAWKLIIKLLPDQVDSIIESDKPLWRKIIPENWKEHVTHQEYWEQVSFYAELAVSMAGYDTVKLGELIDLFDKLPKPSFDKLLAVLLSDAILELPEDKKLHLWDKTTNFTSMHRRFSNAKWALDEDLLSTIDQVANRLAPSDPLCLYQRLFSNKNFDLYEENDDWKEKERKIAECRQKAVRGILGSSGIGSVIQFAEAVELPKQVGHSLGCIANVETDTVLLPAYIKSGNRKLSSFINGYIWIRHHTNGWTWADALDKSDWDNGQVGQFLSSLPFTNGTWDRAAKWLGDAENEYWRNTDASLYEKDSDLGIAIDKLIKYERPDAAINCLYYRMHNTNQPNNVDQCMKVLLAASSSSELLNPRDVYYSYIEKLIEALQENPKVDLDDLCSVEWAYLPLLNSHRNTTPKSLECRLANDPEFFCEVIRLIYRSNKSDGTTNKLSDKEKAIATNAWKLFHKWHNPPGMQEDGSFNDTHFLSWLQRVKEICTESGHMEFASTNVGKVLIHCPPDTSGLWINRTVANELNARDAEDIRDGFRRGLRSSRGVHWVDPTGKPEKELAEQYRQKAEDTENAGYHRLATTLRELSEYYDQDAELIVNSWPFSS